MLPHRRVLIADDDREVRLGLADLLEAMGLETVQAETGPEALALCQRRLPMPIDLLLLDVHMPGCTGLDVLCALRRDEVLVPCIFYSGNATAEIERRALESGALAVLHKPVQPLLLRSTVLRALSVDPPRP